MRIGQGWAASELDPPRLEVRVDWLRAEMAAAEKPLAGVALRVGRVLGSSPDWSAEREYLDACATIGVTEMIYSLPPVERALHDDLLHALIELRSSPSFSEDHVHR